MVWWNKATGPWFFNWIGRLCGAGNETAGVIFCLQH
jgi:hypothetical protein